MEQLSLYISGNDDQYRDQQILHKANREVFVIDFHVAMEATILTRASIPRINTAPSYLSATANNYTFANMKMSAIPRIIVTGHKNGRSIIIEDKKEYYWRRVGGINPTISTGKPSPFFCKTWE